MSWADVWFGAFCGATAMWLYCRLDRVLDVVDAFLCRIGFVEPPEPPRLLGGGTRFKQHSHVRIYRDDDGGAA